MLTLLVLCRFQATCEAIVRTYSCLNVPLPDQDVQAGILSFEVIKSDRSAKYVRFIEQFKWRSYGKRKQKEIYIEAEREGIEDGERLQKTWRQQQRSGTPGRG